MVDHSQGDVPASFEDLVKIDGVVTAGEFRIDGTLVDYRATMNMSPEPATSAQDLLAFSMLFNLLPPAFEGLRRRLTVQGVVIRTGYRSPAPRQVDDEEYEGRDGDEQSAMTASETP